MIKLDRNDTLVLKNVNLGTLTESDFVVQTVRGQLAEIYNRVVPQTKTTTLM